MDGSSERARLEQELLSLTGADDIGAAIGIVSDEYKLGLERLPAGGYRAIMPCPGARAEDEHVAEGATKEIAIMRCALDVARQRAPACPSI